VTGMLCRDNKGWQTIFRQLFPEVNRLCDPFWRSSRTAPSLATPSDHDLSSFIVDSAGQGFSGRILGLPFRVVIPSSPLGGVLCRPDQCSRNSYVDNNSCLISELLALFISHDDFASRHLHIRNFKE
jgi:hypothetical protein